MTEFITKQSKLTKEEWTSIEVPCVDSEKRILSLISDGYNDVNISRNYTSSLAQHMKMTDSKKFDSYIYKNYFHDTMSKLYKKFNIVPASASASASTPTKKEKPIVLKKADIIRMENTTKNIEEQKHMIFEYILIDLLEKLLQHQAEENDNKSKNRVKKSEANKTKWMYYYFTLYKLMKYKIEGVNNELREKILSILSQKFVECYTDNGNYVNLITDMVEQGYELIEKNEYLLKYADETLYDHQKELFTLCKNPAPKLILYIAPTGTGKTMSPLGLSTTHRVIFVCAARHVGLSLAKAAISMQKKIAFAFGCNDAEDIRLHYFAAKEYTKHTKSGGIGKVDNSQGEKVELMISDVQSYIPAMLYMLAFNPKEKIITYWDEPTMTMDYTEHDLHKLINKNWCENLIPNMVLSSATLPQQKDITDTIMDFCSRFNNVDVHEVISYDCKKTIPLINREGFAEMPHYLYDDYAKILDVVEHCKEHKTLLRYIDLREAIRFIMLIHKGGKKYMKTDRYNLNTYFTEIDMVNMGSIKVFYLELLGNLKPELYSEIYTELTNTRKKYHESNVNIVTTDAHTLTDGPTIFLADDINKIAQFYIQNAKIPDYVLKEIMEKIQYNRKLNEQIKSLEKELEDARNSLSDKSTSDDKLSPEMKEKKQKLATLKTSIQTIVLPPTFVPNTRDHLYKYASKMNPGEITNAFTSNVSEENVEQIMRITDVMDYWKLLLLMGIGVFSEHKSPRYIEIMKRMAQEHKLFMIIASTDYIYGTNYQFCHGYIGKDLGEMSQEKCIQAMGRVGRNKLQQNYSVRFRDNALIHKLFNKDDDKPEVMNMNRLFNEM